MTSMPSKFSFNHHCQALVSVALRSVILTDASAAIINFALVQHGLDGTSKVISCGSWSLNPVEKRYTPLELEALGAVFAIQKCSFYMLGFPTSLIFISDYQPLIGFFQRLGLKVVGANVCFE